MCFLEHFGMICDTLFPPRLEMLFFIFFALSVLFSLLFLLIFYLFFDIAEIVPTRAGSSGSDLGHSLCFSVVVSVCLLFLSCNLTNMSSTSFKNAQKEKRRERK